MPGIVCLVLGLIGVLLDMLTLASDVEVVDLLVALAPTAVLLLLAAWLLVRRVVVDGDGIAMRTWRGTVRIAAHDVVMLRAVTDVEVYKNRATNAVTITARDATQRLRFTARGALALEVLTVLRPVAVRLAEALRPRLSTGLAWTARATLHADRLVVNRHTKGTSTSTTVLLRDIERSTDLPAGLAIFRRGDRDPVIVLPLDIDDAWSMRILFDLLHAAAMEPR